MKLITTSNLRQAWDRALDTILTEGHYVMDEEKQVREVIDLFMVITDPAFDASLVELNSELASWMHDNFTSVKNIPELGNARSYGWRLHDNDGKDQVKYITNKLKQKPESKSATITMLHPSDTTYIPCVSLLDFKIRDGRLLLTATCRSLDFGGKQGGKALYNMVELVRIGKEVAAQVGTKMFTLRMHVISAHVYETQ